jgi:hypothetical protein
MTVARVADNLMRIFAKELCDFLFVIFLDGVDEIELDEVRLDVAQEMDVFLIKVKKEPFIQKIPMREADEEGMRAARSWVEDPNQRLTKDSMS